jgi:hypothetical protein
MSRYKHFCYLGAFKKFRKATLIFVMSFRLPARTSVCPSTWNNSTPIGWVFMKFDIKYFSKICQEYSRLVLTRIMGTLHEDRYAFFIISRSVLLGRGNVSDKSFREKQNTYFVFNNSFFFFFSPYTR